MKMLLSLFLSLTMLLLSFSISNFAYADSYNGKVYYETKTRTVTFYQTDARKMLNFVNDFRASDETWYWLNYEKHYIIDDYSDIPEYAEKIGTPLIYDYELEKIAMQRAADITYKLEHERPNGDPIWSLSEPGYLSGENICGTVVSTSTTISSDKTTAAFKLFKEDISTPQKNGMNSQGHRINMMEAYKTFACACCLYKNTYYWVQLFGDNMIPNGENKTTAIDGKKKVSFDVVHNGTYALLYDGSTYSVDGEDNEAGLINIEISAGRYKPSPQLYVVYLGFGDGKYDKKIASELIPSNSNIQIKDGKIYGKKCGSAKVRVKSDAIPENKNVSFSVKVNHTYKLIKNKKPTLKKAGKKIYQCTCCKKKKTVTVPKLLPSVKGIKVKKRSDGYYLCWKKSKNISGYMVQEKPDGSTISVSKNAKSHQIQFNEKGKTVKVRIRTYKKLKNNKFAYSKWSKWKKVKIK